MPMEVHAAGKYYQDTSRRAAPGVHHKVAEKVASGVLSDGGDDGDEFDATFTEEDTRRAFHHVPLDPQPPPPPPSHQQGDLKGRTAAETAFRCLLVELGIHGFSRYERELPKLQTDPRFAALPPDQRRAIFESYCTKIGQTKKKQAQQHTTKKGPSSDNTAIEASFKALLQERVVRSDARWQHDTNVELKDDDQRWRGLSLERREALFNSHVDALWKMEEGRKEAHRRAQHEEMAAKERKKVAGEADAAYNFSALLAEAIRDPGADWSSSWPRLQQDPQGRASHPLLHPQTAERHFNKHVAALTEQAMGGFIELLVEHRASLLSSNEWSRDVSDTVESLVGQEVRFQKLPAQLRPEAWRLYRQDDLNEIRSQVRDVVSRDVEKVGERDTKRQRKRGDDSTVWM